MRCLLFVGLMLLSPLILLLLLGGLEWLYKKLGVINDN